MFNNNPPLAPIMIEDYNQFLLLTSLHEKSATAQKRAIMMESAKNVKLLQKRNRQGPIDIILEGVQRGTQFPGNLKPGPTLREDVLSFFQSGATT